jgi:hypothetical protein
MRLALLIARIFRGSSKKITGHPHPISVGKPWQATRRPISPRLGCLARAMSDPFHEITELKDRLKALLAFGSQR